MRSAVFGFLFLLFFSACNNNEEEARAAASENDVDAARNFITAVLTSDFKKARTLLVEDSASHQDLNVTERMFSERLSPEEKMGYRQASINIHGVTPQGDSASIVHY